MKTIVIALSLAALSGCAIVPLACYDCYDPYRSSYSASAINIPSEYPKSGYADSPHSLPYSGSYGYRYHKFQHPGYYGYGYPGYRYPGYYGHRNYRPLY